MATYILAVAFDAGDPTDDQLHGDGEYGFAVDNGTGPAPVGNSGSSGRTFQTITIPPVAGGNSPNNFGVSLFTNISGVDPNASFFRCMFRPAHDAAPSTNPQLSPLNGADTNALLTGVTFGSGGANSNVAAAAYGLPAATYASNWMCNGYTLQQGRQNSSSRYEVSIEVCVFANGAWSYFKVDPEMVIDF